MYIYIMENILIFRDKVLEILKNRLDGFYLAGGTALSVFYYQHRKSFDLDFFTQNFSKIRIEQIMGELSKLIKLNVELGMEQNQKGMAKILIYFVEINKENSLKIDFVEDVVQLIKKLNIINDIPVLSLEDIYIRKIYAISGVSQSPDSVGRKNIIGGRQEAKDLFDLYFLSTTFMPLSEFAASYCSQQQIENIIIWYRTYNRTMIKLGLNDIVTNKTVDYVTIERHFKSEVERIIMKSI